MASLIVIVTQSLDVSTLPMIRPLLQLSSVMYKQTNGVAPAAALMIREVGVPGHRSDPFDVQNQKRIQQDERELQLLRDKLKADLPPQVKVFAQPDRQSCDLYWASLDDFIRFFSEVLSSAPALSGAVMLAHMEKAQKFVGDIGDLMASSVPFQVWFEKIRVFQLNEIEQEIGQGICELVRTRVNSISLNDLREISPNQLTSTISSELHLLFDRRVNESVVGGVQSASALSQKENLTRSIKNQVENSYFDRCFNDIVKPIVNQGIENTRQQLERIQIQPPAFISYNFTQLKTQVTEDARTWVVQQLNGLTPIVLEDVRYKIELDRLNCEIGPIVSAFEKKKQQEYTKWRADEEARQRREEEARRKAEQEERRREQEAAKQARTLELRKLQRKHEWEMLKLEQNTWDTGSQLSFAKTQTMHLCFRANPTTFRLNHPW
jgi:hypothetical protein